MKAQVARRRTREIKMVAMKMEVEDELGTPRVSNEV